MSESIYESEDQCDIWIEKNLCISHPGFFVDVGAAHPGRYSQTHWLRAQGWRGLAIDGTPEYAAEWANEDKVTFIHAVLSDQPEVRFINERTNSLVSRVHPEGTPVPARKLSSILREYGVDQIDFMAIDIEASERVVLSEMFSEGFRPNIIVAEYNSQHAGMDAELIGLIIEHGYQFVHMTISNGVFVLRK